MTQRPADLDPDRRANIVAVVALRRTAERLRDKFPDDPRMQAVCDALLDLAADLERGARS